MLAPTPGGGIKNNKVKCLKIVPFLSYFRPANHIYVHWGKIGLKQGEGGRGSVEEGMAGNDRNAQYIPLKKLNNK